MHDHVYDVGSHAAERGTRLVIAITAVMMVVEILAGWWFNSMALLADGWHMSSHAGAIGVSAFAYAASRRHARDPRFAFGTWKIEVLGGFSSALFLLGIAALMVAGSIERIVSPRPIAYREAIVVAAVGLVVNVVCAIILGRAHDDAGGGHARGADEGPHHDDLNLKSAYLHVLADAATSVLAIVALAGGWLYGWSWLDPVMGIAGAVLVGTWARRLIIETGRVLLDREMDHPVVEAIREAVERREGGPAARVTDLHVWRVGRRSYACALTVASSDAALTAAAVRAWLAAHDEIRHATIEIDVSESG
jgi:cation diffusion facilitator family transporter